MKTLTITISDEAAANLARAVEGGAHTAEQIASHVVESAYSDDWGDLSAEDIAAIEEGLAQADRGEFASEEEIEAAYARFQR